MSYEAWGEPDDPYYSPDQLAELGWISPDEYSKGAIDVLNERLRQQDAEGWTAEHDDALTGYELARLAMSYAQHAGYNDKVRRDRERRGPTALHASAMSWFKPSTRRRDLVKAGALILAEIDRLDRLEARSAEGRRPPAQVARAGEPMWGAYWYGSRPNKGANIWTIDSYGNRSDLILHVGTEAEHLDLARAICTLHNQRASPTAPQSAGAAPPEGQPPAGGDTPREAK